MPQEQPSAGGLTYVPGRGWVDTGSANAAGIGLSSLGVQNPQAAGRGREMDPVINSLPEIAGLVASLFPGARGAKELFTLGRAGVGAGVPAIADLVQQLMEGKDLTGLDPIRATGRGVANYALPEAVRAGARGVGNLGREMVGETLTMGGKATRDIMGKKVVPSGSFTPKEVKGLTDDAIELHVTLSQPQIDALGQKWLTLQNDILAKYPQATTVEQAMSLARTARDPLATQMDKVARMAPQLEKALGKSMTQAAGPARYLAGAGTGGAVGAGAMAMGADPQTAAVLGTAIGLPVGLSQASPAMKLSMGELLAKVRSGEVPLETVVRSLMAGLMEVGQ